jgi:hypothetical protein
MSKITYFLCGVLVALALGFANVHDDTSRGWRTIITIKRSFCEGEAIYELSYGDSSDEGAETLTDRWDNDNTMCCVHEETLKALFPGLTDVISEKMTTEDSDPYIQATMEIRVFSKKDQWWHKFDLQDIRSKLRQRQQRNGVIRAC